MSLTAGILIGIFIALVCALVNAGLEAAFDTQTSKVNWKSFARLCVVTLAGLTLFQPVSSFVDHQSWVPGSSDLELALGCYEEIIATHPERPFGTFCIERKAGVYGVTGYAFTARGDLVARWQGILTDIHPGDMVVQWAGSGKIFETGIAQTVGNYGSIHLDHINGNAGAVVGDFIDVDREKRISHSFSARRVDVKAKDIAYYRHSQLPELTAL